MIFTFTYTRCNPGKRLSHPRNQVTSINFLSTLAFGLSLNVNL
jgi:hypothetical protein